MIDRQHLEELARRQLEINALQSELTNEFQKYSRELFQKAKDVLKWKDDNLEQSFLEYTTRGHIHKLRQNSLTLCLPDTDCELSPHYYNVSFDEIFSDDWKEIALKEYEEMKQRKLEDERLAKEQELLDKELKERAEYERLKAKYEK